MKPLRLAGMLVLCSWLAACVSQTVTTNTVPSIQGASTVMPETLLLDVGIPVFDPGLLDYEEGEQTYPEVRKAEARFMAFLLAEAMQESGAWGAVRVVPNPEQLLLPGIYVRAIVGIGVRADAILAPQRGIQRGAKGETTAMVLGADDKVEMRAVRVSQTVGDQWLVEEGLKAGDRVIVDGLQKIAPGMPAPAAGQSPAAAPAAAPQG